MLHYSHVMKRATIFFLSACRASSDRVMRLIGLSRASTTRALECQIQAMESAYKDLADARAQQAMEKVIESQIGQTNQMLMGYLAESQGVQWVYGPGPAQEQTDNI